ncbi:hypothetical protein LYNGBM3L_63950 [Moorena producens 3L]|uniref:Uncharacterized protein n=1 Tax=Moorena producens 3L TaxID=489825 RepID=F4Y0X5_9CYAN|nr:hypothetical protein LYNGBM3L_63950 [Moorena producens 3L]OLT67950.1 hypothetical protein BI334_25590 [Moorena producens 3L]
MILFGYFVFLPSPPCLPCLPFPVLDTEQWFSPGIGRVLMAEFGNACYNIRIDFNNNLGHLIKILNPVVSDKLRGLTP